MKKYNRVFSGVVKEGDQYMGDVEKNCEYKPREWTDANTSLYGKLIQNCATFIFRRPVTIEDKKYIRVFSGAPMIGDQYIGNKAQCETNAPDEWTELKLVADDSEHIERLPTLIFRRPVKNLFSPSDGARPPLSSYSIAELMLWRDTASNRLDKYDRQLESLEKMIDTWVNRYIKVMKKRKHDAVWVSKLNGILHRKVMKKGI